MKHVKKPVVCLERQVCNMPNMQFKKYPMPLRNAAERCSDFEEVAIGYDEETAMLEADRCLNCRTHPCVNGCPVGIDIPAFLMCAKDGEFEKSYEILAQSSSLPAVCGRVCPQENQCEKYCTRGIKGEPVGIGRIERYVADRHSNLMRGKDGAAASKSTGGRKVAVIGSGPAGLACAGDLARLGYSVTVFEALHVAGGVLVYGIPEFRLPKYIVADEISALEKIGVKIVVNAVVGKCLTIDELMHDDGFEAVFIGTGAGLPQFMGIPGENLNGVYSANEFLTRINLMKAYKDDSATPIMRGKHVAVIGGGNVAMDAARCARRFGSEVTIIYRRTAAELPARHEEADHAVEEGVAFNYLCSPTEIHGENGWVESMRCVRMELGAPDVTGRRRPVVIAKSEFDIPVDCVIIAIGTSPNPLIKDTTSGLDVNRHGCIIADENTCLTSRDGVFAGGDAVTGSATVILAMGAGKAAAKAIDEYIRSK